jgi:3-oxoacyl-[acyl-carrier protein] reductase
MGVLVTGASRGIGRAVALRLAETRDVAVNFHLAARDAWDVVESARERGSDAIPVEADVSDPDEVDAMVERVVEELGTLEAVVNNAGVLDPHPVTDITDEGWETVIETNLSGAFYVVRAAVPHLTPGGDVVNVSGLGATAGTADAAFAASKAGLHGLTRALAGELGPRGVQVNAVSPGRIATDTNEAVGAFGDATDRSLPEPVLDTEAAVPEAVAHTVEYLLDNRFVHGEVVNVNGGAQFR